MNELTDESILPKNRLETLVDGIFAITMTLMILDLKTPENIPSTAVQHELPVILYNLLPFVEAYAVSFIILGIFWLRHQIQFKYFRSVTRSLIAMNILFLLLIGFVPFTVSIMMRYPDFPLAFRIYIINLFLISILLTIQWIIAARSKNIIAGEVAQTLNKRFTVLTLTPAVIFLIAFFVSYYNPRYAFLVIYLDPLFYLVVRRIRKNKPNTN